MKRIALAVVFALVFSASAAFAQNHGEVGAFADYVRLHNANDANFWGLGGRASFNVAKHAQLEGELAYDFEKTFTTGTVTGGTITTSRTGLRLLSGLFGPKIGTSGPVRVFVTAKGGFLNFSVNNKSALTGVTSAFTQVTSGDTNGVFYPGGGVEGFIGPVGLRLDVGDLMYFDRGANHNLRITFGPQFRF